MIYLVILILILIFIVSFKFIKSSYVNSSEDNSILLYVDTGLGDRVLCVAGYKVICDLLGYNLKYNPNNCITRCINNDLISFKDVEITDRTEPYKNFIDHHGIPVKISPYEIYKITSKLKPEITFEEIYTKYLHFIQNNLIFSDAIKKYGTTEEYEGIHIRHGDRNGDGMDRTLKEDLDKYIERLNSDILKNDVKYIIICDNETENLRQNIIEMLKDRIKIIEIPEINEDDKSKYGVTFKDCLDYYYLSKCKTIYQITKFSGFSLSAAIFGNANLINYDENGYAVKAWNCVLSINGNTNYDVNFFKENPYFNMWQDITFSLE